MLRAQLISYALPQAPCYPHGPYTAHIGLVLGGREAFRRRVRHETACRDCDESVCVCVCLCVCECESFEHCARVPRQSVSFALIVH